MLFSAKTQEGDVFKVLIELLQQIIKTGCFEINEQGIFIRMMEQQTKFLVNLELGAHNFNMFEVKHPLYVGVNLSHLYKILKSIKKKESLMMFIDEKDPQSLQIVVHSQDRSHQSHSTVQIQPVQKISVNLPGPYSNPVIVSSGEYQRTLKDMNNINNSVLRVRLQKYCLHLSNKADNVYSRTVRFGELSDESPFIYDEEFDIEYFTRIIKISGLNKNIQIHGSENLPLFIKVAVGQLGFLSIFIKSRKQMNLISN